MINKITYIFVVVLVLCCIDKVICGIDDQLAKQFFEKSIKPDNQMEKEIVSDFLKGGYLKDVDNQTDLQERFTYFKKEWMENMIENIILGLEISDEGAAQVRKNPSEFYFNYETYKLLTYI